MFNVIKAQSYQIRRDNTTYYYIIGAFLFSIFMGLVILTDSGGGEMDGSRWFVNVTSFSMSYLGNLFALMFTARICGWDLQDRTLNYELMNGCKRSSIYLGRVVLSLLWSLGIVYAVTVIPLAAVGLTKGWGDMISLEGVVRRLAMAAFPLIKMCCLYALLTFLILDWRAVIAIGFVFGQIEMLAAMMLDELSINVPKAVTECITAFAMNKILDCSNTALGYKDGEDIVVIKDSFTAGQLVPTLAVCAAGAVLYLILGYALFRKRDLK